MNKKYIFRLAQLAIAVAVVVVLQKCGTDDAGINPAGDFMAGTITFSDSNFQSTSGGHYSVSFYTSLSQAPVRSDSLTITKTNNVATSYYKTSGLASTTYYVACTWTNRSTGAITVLGEYGCDPPPTCSTPTAVEFPSYAGTAALNFKSNTH
jgi:hypothetical protein